MNITSNIYELHAISGQSNQQLLAPDFNKSSTEVANFAGKRLRVLVPLGKKIIDKIFRI